MLFELIRVIRRLFCEIRAIRGLIRVIRSLI